MTFIENRSPWFDRFIRLIEWSWRHHGPCSNLHVSCAFDNDSGEWVIVAAPVYQEVLGGEDDGKTVWTGFVFEADKVDVHISLGVSTTTTAIEAQAFIKQADENLFRAKRAGRDRVVG